MYFRKKAPEELPKEETAIWACTKEGCTGWMRDNFTFETVPTCWQCNSPMTRSMKMLPMLANKKSDKKAMKTGSAIK